MLTETAIIDVMSTEYPEATTRDVMTWQKLHSTYCYANINYMLLEMLSYQQQLHNIRDIVMSQNLYDIREIVLSMQATWH